MKERFSKSLILYCLECWIAQTAWEFETKGYGKLEYGTSYGDMEGLCEDAQRLHGRYNGYQSVYHFIKTWGMQSMPKPPSESDEDEE